MMDPSSDRIMSVSLICLLMKQHQFNLVSKMHHLSLLTVLQSSRRKVLGIILCSSTKASMCSLYSMANNKLENTLKTKGHTPMWRCSTDSAVHWLSSLCKPGTERQEGGLWSESTTVTQVKSYTG